MLGENPKSLLDMLAFAEKMDWLENGEKFIAAKKLRNLLVHEYMIDSQLFLQTLLSANTATDMLLAVVNAVAGEAERLSLPSPQAKRL